MRDMIRERLKTVGERISETNLLDLATMVWSSDRQGVNSQYEATYRHVSSKLREWNIRARPFEVPGDGKTVLGDWRMPVAWECFSALLEIIDPFELRHKVLADRKKRPQAVVAFSGATPSGGITAHLIRIRDEAEFEAKKAQLKGKLAYILADPRTMKKRLIAAGAVGVVSGWSPAERYLPDATASVESWCDEPDEPGFHDGDAAFPAMLVSPETGVELDVLFDRGTVRVKLVIEAKHEAAGLPITCGYIDAELQEEIVAICSTQRMGANAGASGAAVMLEAMHSIQSGIAAGALPPVKRALRALLAGRGHGSIGFAAKNPGILRRAVAGLNFESVGRYAESAGAAFTRHDCPDAAASVADTLLSILIEEHFGDALPHASLKHAPYAFVDNAYNDPLIGVPTPAIRGTDRLMNTSADSAENPLSAKGMKAFATVAGAYMHILAVCTQQEALWLAHETVRRYGTRIEAAAAECAGRLHRAENEQGKQALLALAFDRMEYIKEISEKAVMSAKNFMLREERAAGHLILMKYCRHLRRLVDLEKRRLKELADCDAGALVPPAVPPDLAGLRPYKKFIGTPAYGGIESAMRSDEHGALASPRENAQLHAACFHANGTLTFEEIARLVTHEFQHEPHADFWRHFRFMGKNGLMQLLQPGEAVPKPPKPVKLDSGMQSETRADEAAAPVEVTEATEEVEAIPAEETAEVAAE